MGFGSLALFGYGVVYDRNLFLHTLKRSKWFLDKYIGHDELVEDYDFENAAKDMFNCYFDEDTVVFIVSPTHVYGHREYTSFQKLESLKIPNISEIYEYMKKLDFSGDPLYVGWMLGSNYN
jgi:hypothetical protein